MESSVKTTRKKYVVLSPDGFAIDFRKAYYTSRKKAIEAFNIWKERYQMQGYYSSNSGRITLEELEDYCQFKVI